MTWAALRVKGTVSIRPDIKDTMRMLRLTRANHCVLLAETPSNLGMLRKVKDYVTWGEVEPPVVTKLLEARGRLEGDKPLTPEVLKEAGYGSVEDLAAALCGGKADLAAVPGLKPVLRLPPPRRGYESIKRAYQVGGTLGYRGRDINELLLRMVEREA